MILGYNCNGYCFQMHIVRRHHIARTVGKLKWAQLHGKSQCLMSEARNAPIFNHIHFGTNE